MMLGPNSGWRPLVTLAVLRGTPGSLVVLDGRRAGERMWYQGLTHVRHVIDHFINHWPYLVCTKFSKLHAV